eukprot:6389782-Pyramimonas_sp.AAC.1
MSANKQREDGGVLASGGAKKGAAKAVKGPGGQAVQSAIDGPDLFLDGSSFASPGKSDFSYPWLVAPKKSKPKDDEDRRGSTGPWGSVHPSSFAS